MEPFHAFLALKCPACTTSLIRIAHSESQDLVVCPVCFTAGGYDEVIEENAALENSHVFPDDLKLLIQELHAQRPQSG